MFEKRLFFNAEINSATLQTPNLFLCVFPFNSGVLLWTQKRGHEVTACIVNTARAPPSFASAATHRHGHAHHSSHFQSKPVCVAFDLFSAITPRLCWKKKIYIYLHELLVRILVSSVVGQQKKIKRAVFGHVASVKWKWRTSDIVSSLSPPCLSVAVLKAGWLCGRWGRRTACGGHCACIERCAEWITFPGNSCHIHRSRAEDRKSRS